MAYTPDSQYNTSIVNGFFKPEYTKSYSFYITPRFPIEKQVKIVVWVIDDISKVTDEDGRKYLSGLQKQPDGTYQPFKYAGNKAIEVSFFNLPNINPKTGAKLENNTFTSFDVNAEPTKPNMNFKPLSLYAVQERFDKGEEKGTKPTTLDSYIDHVLVIAKNFYKRAIYQLTVSSEADFPKFELTENAVELTQTPQTADPPQPVPVVDFTFSPDRIKPGGKVTFTNKTTNSTEFTWSATPNTSIVWETITASNPTATFNANGTFSISLQAKNSFGTVSFTSPVILSVTASEPPKDPPPVSTTASQIDPTKVSSKLKLVKVSGPGELVGITEIDVSSASASFTGLQFTEGGTYVIDVVPTSPDLEKTQFTVVVESEPANIEQDKPGAEEKPPTGPRPIIAQIEEPNQKIPPLKRPIQNNKDEAVESMVGMGMKPLIGYNGAEIAREVHIKQLLLYYQMGGNYENIPLCKVQFTDSNNLIKDNPPQDDTKFEIFLNSSDALIKSIHLVFKILNHKKQPDNSYIFEGVLSVDDLYVPSSKSYKGTSFEALRKIAKNLNLGFNSNIDGDTNDEMKWINTNKEYKDFIKEIIQHSYKDENTFLYGFIDFYYCFNYIDVEKEYKRDIGNDFMVETGNADRMVKDKDKKIVPLFLTNEPSHKTSVGYFESYKVVNQSTSTKIKEGYGTVTRYYDEEKKTIVEFKVDSQSNPDQKTINLKGEQGSNSFLDKKIVKKFLGKFDTDNVHKNYNYAPEQNRKNLDNLTSVVVIINMPNPNYNLYKFQKVEISFFIIGSTPTSDWPVDYRLSGEWIIIDIAFEMVSNTKGNKFVQRLTCARKEMGKTPEEIKNDKSSSTPETKGDNKNETPTDNQPKPNSKYKVGDKIQVAKFDGTIYEIEITNVLENGTEVEGTLTKK